MPGSLEKIRMLRSMIRERELPVALEVDGGIDLGNAPQVVAAGADVLVAGNTIFSSPDPTGTIRSLKQAG